MQHMSCLLQTDWLQPIHGWLAFAISLTARVACRPSSYSDFDRESTALRGSWLPWCSLWRAVALEEMILIHPLWAPIRAVTCWTTTSTVEAEWDREEDGCGGTNDDMAWSGLCTLGDKCALTPRLALPPQVQVPHLHRQKTTNVQRRSRVHEPQRHMYARQLRRRSHQRRLYMPIEQNVSSSNLLMDRHDSYQIQMLHALHLTFISK